MKGLYMMYGYKGKIAGFIIAGIGIVAMIIEKLTHFTVIKKLTPEQHFNAWLWLTLLGLFTAMFSKEKNEDERVQHIRARSLMTVFAIMIGATMAFALTTSLMPTLDREAAEGMTLTAEDIVMGGRMLMYYPAVALVLYHVLFHIGLYFDSAWEYEERTWSFRLLWKHKRYKILFKIIAIAIITLLFYLMK